ncbi:MAG: LytTR family DNA-binding domain-containing protein [Clostridia bacterium]
MKVEIKIGENQKEPKIILVTEKITDEIRDLAKRISDINSATIVGYKDDKAELISFDEIINIYASSAKVFAVTSTNKFILKMKLYEIEKQFAGSNFIRISYSEIINMNKVQNFDLSKTGTICVKMTNGESLYVSRRNVQKIKKYLEI